MIPEDNRTIDLNSGQEVMATVESEMRRIVALQVNGNRKAWLAGAITLNFVVTFHVDKTTIKAEVRERTRKE